MFDAEYMRPIRGTARYLTASALFRGRVSTKDVDEQTLNPQKKNSSYVSNGFRTNIKVSVSVIFPRFQDGGFVPRQHHRDS